MYPIRCAICDFYSEMAIYFATNKNLADFQTFQQKWLDFQATRRHPRYIFICISFNPQYVNFIQKWHYLSIKMKKWLIFALFLAKMTEFLGHRKTFQIHFHMYIIQCTIGDFYSEMEISFATNKNLADFYTFQQKWLDFQATRRHPRYIFICISFNPQYVNFIQKWHYLSIKMKKWLIFALFLAKMTEFLGHRKTFQIHFHMYIIQCTIGDFYSEMEISFDKNQNLADFQTFQQKWLKFQASGRHSRCIFTCISFNAQYVTFIQKWHYLLIKIKKFADFCTFQQKWLNFQAVGRHSRYIFICISFNAQYDSEMEMFFYKNQNLTLSGTFCKKLLNFQNTRKQYRNMLIFTSLNEQHATSSGMAIFYDKK